MNGTKDGLLTKEELKFFVDISVDGTGLSGIWGTTTKMFLPTVLDMLDNKVGDRVPEPWQSQLENLFTHLYNAMQDKVISEKEQALLENDCAIILNSAVDIPEMSEDDELLQFALLIKYGVVGVRAALKKLKE